MKKANQQFKFLQIKNELPKELDWELRNVLPQYLS